MSLLAPSSPGLNDTDPSIGGGGGFPGLPAPNYINPEQRGTKLRALVIFLCCLAWVFCLLRFWSRTWIAGRIKLDDWLIVIGLAFTTALTICLAEATRYGIGYHFYDIPPHWWLPQTRLVFIVGMLYNPCLGFIKASIILFFYQLAPHRSFRYSCYALLFLAVGTAVGTTLFAIFACNPVDFHWNPHHYGSFHPGLPGKGVKCFDLMTMLVWFGGINAVTDVLTLLLPVPLVWKVQLPLRQKAVLGGIFALGGFVCITSITRTAILNQLRRGDAKDYSYDLFLCHLWSITECTVGIICACLPVCRPLLAKFLPGLFALPRTKASTRGDMPAFVPKVSKASGSGGEVGRNKYGISETVLMESRFDEEGENADMGSIESGKNGAAKEGWQMQQMGGKR